MSPVNRRDALKSLATLAGVTGITLTPVTTHEATDITMVILRTERRFSAQEAEHLRHLWELACRSTALQDVKTIVVDSGVTVELVRGRL